MTKSRYFGTLLGAALSLVVGTTTSYGAYYAPGTTLAGSEPLANDPFVLGPTTPGKWGPAALGTGATVTWSLMSTGVSCGGDCTVGDAFNGSPASPTSTNVNPETVDQAAKATMI